jgi:hypothetical protein
MGEKTMFDLNEQIKKWRCALVQSEAFDKSDIDELESHLKEEIERLITLKLSEEEAFWGAIHRIGDRGALASEFAKVNWPAMLKRRIFWMAAGILAYLFASYLAGAASQACILLAGLGGVRSYVLGLVGVVSNLAILGLVVIFFCLSYRHNWKILRFGLWLNNFAIRTILVGGFIAAVVFLNAARILFSTAAARMMSVQEYGQMAFVGAYLQLLIPILLAVVLVVILVRLRSSEFGAIEN